MTKTHYETTLTGVKFEGDWNDVCNFTKDLENTLQDIDVNENSVKKLHNWRPRKNESTDDLKEKTAREASLGTEGKEKECDNPEGEIKKASRDIAEAGNKLMRLESPRLEMKNASKKVYRYMRYKSINSIRKAEKSIYKNVMLQLNPHYFDTRDFSLNLLVRNNGKCTLNINVTDKDIRDSLKMTLKEGS